MDSQAWTAADPLTDLLNGVRTTGALFHRSLLEGPWAVRFEDASPLALAVPLNGSVWVRPRDGEPVHLGPQDVAVLSGGSPYVVARAIDTEPGVTVRPGGRCTTLDGGEHSTTRGPSTLGAPGPGDPVLVSGMYSVRSGEPRRLLAALPPLAVVPADQGTCPVGPTALEDLSRPAAGRQALLDRMLDLMLITALRSWFTRPGAPVPAWYRAHGDTVVGPALRLMGEDPARPWTVGALAAEVGVSRAALARRFTSLVGRPPMTYLREQRITLAADLLRDPEATLGAVAGRVGFSSAFALSAAFTRMRGISPSEHRAVGTPTEGATSHAGGRGRPPGRRPVRP